MKLAARCQRDREAAKTWCSTQLLGGSREEATCRRRAPRPRWDSFRKNGQGRLRRAFQSHARRRREATSPTTRPLSRSTSSRRRRGRQGRDGRCRSSSSLPTCQGRHGRYRARTSKRPSLKPLVAKGGYAGFDAGARADRRQGARPTGRGRTLPATRIPGPELSRSTRRSRCASALLKRSRRCQQTHAVHLDAPKAATAAAPAAAPAATPPPAAPAQPLQPLSPANAPCI